jgi:hypothetical protein
LVPLVILAGVLWYLLNKQPEQVTQEPVTPTQSVVVGGVDVGKQLNDSLTALRSSLQGITDEASAKAALFCKNEKVDHPAVDLGAVIDFYNEAAANLPDHTKLRDHRLPGASAVLDRKGRPFAEVFEENQRRVWVRLEDIPAHVRNAFIAAEDKRFYQHHGIDEHGLIRAFVGNLAHSGRPREARRSPSRW